MNTYNVKDNYIEIITKKGEVILVDKEDLERVKNYTWYVDSKGYAQHNNSKNQHIRLHRLILNPPKDKQVDHINHNKLDNRKCNLRIVTNQQNQLNRTLSKNNKSGYNGVYYNKLCNKWCAQITINRKTISAGLFGTIEEAVEARRKLEKKYCLEGIDYEIIGGER